MFGMGSKSIVGLDVGSSSIKAVELRKKGGNVLVLRVVSTWKLLTCWATIWPMRSQVRCNIEPAGSM